MAKKHKVKSQKVQVKKTDKQTNINHQEFQLKNFSIWIAVIVFILTTIIFFWNHLSGSSFFWEDFVEQFYPIQTFAAQSFADWEIPFWNPYTFCGMPFFADLQVGFFYPLNRLTALFLDSNGHLSVWGLQFIIILHFFIAQLSMYKLMQYLKVSSIGSIISSVSFAFSFSLVLHVIHPMMIYHLAWFPLVIMYFMKSINEYKIKYGIIAGLIFGFSMLAGHPQTILYEALFLGFLMIWYLLANLRNGDFKEKPIVKFLIGGGLTFVISVSIFLVQYLPSQDLANLSKRAEASYEAATEGSLEFEQIYTSVTAKFFGYIDGSGDKSLPFHLDDAPYYYYWDTGFYFGLTALLLGLLGIISFYKSRLAGFLIFISLFGFLFALGDNFILFKIFYNLPFFGLLRIPARIMFYAIIVFSIFAGFGFDYLWQSSDNKKRIRNIIIAFSLPLLISLLIVSGILQGALNTPEQYIDKISGLGTVSLLFIISIFIVSFLMIKGIIKPLAAGTIFIILAFTDLYIQGASFVESEKNPENEYKIDNQLKKLFSPTDNNNLFRVSMRHYNPSYMAMMRNQGMIDKIHLVEGYNQLVFNHIPPPCDVDVIHDLYNVKYELAYDNTARQFGFAERQNYYPRLWFVYDVKVIKPENIKSFMQNDKEIDYSRTVILEESPGIKINSKGTAPENSIKILEYDNNKMTINASTSQNAVLVFSEIWYPAWKIFIDGEEQAVYKANYSFRAVSVPAGNHKIEMKYHSAKFYSGMYIAIFSLILSVFAIIFLRKE
jgi:hypothetical protein